MRKKNTEPLKEVIQRYLKVIGAEQKIKEINLKNQWDDIMGKAIAMKTEKTEIKNGVFYIKMSSPVLKHELMLLRNEIVKRLNERAGEELIKEVRFV